MQDAPAPDSVAGWDIESGGVTTRGSIRMADAGGYVVLVTVGGRVLIEKPCADLVEAQFVSRAVWQDTQRGRSLPVGRSDNGSGM